MIYLVNIATTELWKVLGGKEAQRVEVAFVLGGGSNNKGSSSSGDSSRNNKGDGGPVDGNSTNFPGAHPLFMFTDVDGKKRFSSGKGNAVTKAL